ncbi:MAG: SPASM domain-containing protein [Deltaproteobacteria bacterium]|nr:SPASM domain-containing protein [Deltaproteobacteria bacterium]
MHPRLPILGQPGSKRLAPSELPGRPPEVIRFERGAHSLLLATQNLAVIRGETELLRTAERALGAGPDEDVLDDVLDVVDAIRAPAPRADFLGSEPLVTQLNIGNTTRCNMGCSYCYQELPGREAQGKARALDMDLETGRAMVRAVLDQGAPGSQVVLVLIGGESLLQRELLVELLDWARAQGDARDVDVGCVLYTNGALMDQEVIDWADDRSVSLIVSLDGPPVMQDEHRVFLSGKGSSKVVLRNVRRLVETSKQPLRRVRSVATKATQLLPLHKYLYDLGFNELYVQAAYSEDGYDDQTDAREIEALASWYRELLLDGTVIGIHPFTAILERLKKRGAAVTSSHPCNAGIGALGVDANGDLYPCHHFYGETRYRLGNVRDGLPELDARRHIFAPVTSREPCASCWNQRLCGGECYHRAMVMDRGYFGTVTESCAQKKAFSVAALDLFTDVRERRPEVIRRLMQKDYSLPVPKPGVFEIQDLSPYLG